MRIQRNKQQLGIIGPAGELEALLESTQEGEPSGCAVICHPHPLHGGTMQNKVAHTLARSFLGAGFTALRFNFRGVGNSEGGFDNGDGEVEDVLAAVNWMRQEMPNLPLWVAGFSFGAAMAVRAAIDCKPDGLISIAPAVTRFAGKLDTQPECPWLIIQGDQDELVDIDATIAWINKLDPGPEFEVIRGAEHFFHGKLTLLRNAVAEFVRDHPKSGTQP